MQCQTGSLRTLEDASSSSFPLDPQRSVSTSTAATESISIHTSVASLVKKRQEIEEQMIRLQVQLLESFREEWVSEDFRASIGKNFVIWLLMNMMVTFFPHPMLILPVIRFMTAK